MVHFFPIINFIEIRLTGLRWLTRNTQPDFHIYQALKLMKFKCSTKMHWLLELNFLNGLMVHTTILVLKLAYCFR